MKATEEQIKEWKEKYGAVYELEAEGKVCYISDPLHKLSIMKAIMQALTKGSITYVEAILNHCWIAGDESIKTDDRVKIGLIDQVHELIDLPEADIEYNETGAEITVEGKTCKVRMATRGDIKYAEDRNKAGKPLDTQIYLLDRIAIDDLKEWRENIRLYMGLLLAVEKVKERKYVSLKKF
jgi:hypothetical protein